MNIKSWRLINKLRSGLQIALVSDAGTPAISDPGFLLVRACVSEGFEIECLPGATAFVPALVNSGLPSDKFVFEGFASKKRTTDQIELLSEESRTMIFYESPHKLSKTLAQFSEFFGSDRLISVSRELPNFMKKIEGVPSRMS